MEDNILEIGQIVNTHALKGEVKITPWADYPDVFDNIDKVYLEGGKALKINSVRYQKGSVLVKFDGIDSIEAAQKLKGSILHVPKGALGVLPEGRYFIADLIGLTVKDENIVYGKITDVLTTGSNDVYVIKRENQKDLLLPALKSVIIDTDIDSGYMLVKIPEGLLEI